MNVGLIDVDSHNFPNLALMKISSYHKMMGDKVEWYEPLEKEDYDIVYMSKVFTFTEDYIYPINANKIIKGGTGYGDYKSVLENGQEKIYPDYNLYNITDTAYGYLTRGCPRQCPFCIVSKKEGNESIQVADLINFWKNQKYIKLLDPNLLACNDANYILNELIESKASVDFTQGLDARLLTDENIELIKNIKIKIIHFAWDNINDINVFENIKNFIKNSGYNFKKVGVYVLTNFNSTHEQDLERVIKLREIGANPYVMIYDKPSAPKITRELQRWCNNRILFRSCKFSDYNKRNAKIYGDCLL